MAKPHNNLQPPSSILHPPSSIPNPLPSPILLAGPTAAGKSEIALQLAEKINGEIISVDSMQVYRGLDIGTAKPSAADRTRVPHHLIDVVELTEPFDAARFVRLAREAVAEIQSRCRVPILCGGTGLYFKAFLEGLGNSPPADSKLRAELEATPVSVLLHELSERDPVTFESIDRKNPRRVIRAVEVIRLTGKPFSTQRALWTIKNQKSKIKNCFGLARAASDLRARIDARVDDMFRRGLVTETQALLDHGLPRNKTAMQALGYRQVVEHLRGERSLKETVELVKIRTRQFAKRQMTWFRGQLDLEWIELATADTPENVVARILEANCLQQEVE
jgi:tRNA dimethylallyltransferase